MENTCSNCKYWDNKTRIKNVAKDWEGYCDSIKFIDNVYSSNEDEPGVIVTVKDFGCIFFEAK